MRSEKETELTYHWVGWSIKDDLSEADCAYFDDYQECVRLAQEKFEKRTPFIWMAERGEYENQNGRKVEDWLYYWWRGEGIDAGELPSDRHGVPDHRSWQYRVPYLPLDPARRGD